MKTITQDPPSSPDQNEYLHDSTVEDSEKSIIFPDNLHKWGDSCQKESINPWLCRFITSQIPTDLSIQVQETTYNVHKYPLISKCAYIGQLEMQSSILNSTYELKLENFPGGSETFAVVLKFCYGLPIDFNSNNVAALRCASEFLEMTEELEEGNLIFKTEAFLTFVVLSSWKDTVTVLKSCEGLSPWAENLQIVRRCCDSIAWKASKDNITSGEVAIVEEDWWLNDVSTFRIDHLMRIVTAIRAKGAKPETVGKCIMHYAERWLPGMYSDLEGLRCYGHGKSDLQFGVWNGKEEGSVAYKEQKTITENLISILPPEQEAVSCEFLLKMLKVALLYSVSSALISELEKRVGIRLEDANVSDLLIPRYTNIDGGKPHSSAEECMVHDIDVVQRIVEYFLMHEQQRIQIQHKSGKQNVSKLLDNYLAEIAKDPYLTATKFQVLAESLPENSRSCDDGLYRAIDTYMKTHPLLSENERRRLCKIMKCEKLSLDACAHAAQNDRLPLRTVVQVLFSEQMKMRATMQEKEAVVSGHNYEQDGNRSSTDIEIKYVKAELENVKAKLQELQNEYMDLQKEYERLHRKPKNPARWSFGWRKIKNSFHTKVDEDEEVRGRQHTQTPSRKITLGRRFSMS